MIRIFRHYISKAYLWLLIVEFGVFFGAMFLGNYLYLNAPQNSQETLLTCLAFSSLLSLCCAGIGLYRRSLSLEDYDLLSRIAASFLMAIMGVITLNFLIPDFNTAKEILLVAAIVAFVGIIVTRHFFYRIANLEQLKRRVLVIGAGKKALQLTKINNTFIHKSFFVAGFIPTNKKETGVIDPSLIIHSKKSFADIVKEYKIDEIVVAMDDKRGFLPLDGLLDCKMSGTTILDLMSFYEREQALISLENLQPSWLIFSDGFAQGGLRQIEKQFFDLIASIALFIVAWPIMLLTAAAILLESRGKGPVLYRQVRVGENNALFEVLKFRSMHVDAEKNGAQWAQSQDNRVTRVGAIIRKFRIDELPQIFNVLKGEMSFVGPRPERPEFVSDFEKTIPYYSERHRVKPGITGWAQLCYPYGADENDAIQKLQYDLYYVKNYSLFLDISIMFNTVEVVLWGKGAR